MRALSCLSCLSIVTSDGNKLIRPRKLHSLLSSYFPYSQGRIHPSSRIISIIMFEFFQRFTPHALFRKDDMIFMDCEDTHSGNNVDISIFDNLPGGTYELPVGIGWTRPYNVDDDFYELFSEFLIRFRPAQSTILLELKITIPSGVSHSLSRQWEVCKEYASCPIDWKEVTRDFKEWQRRTFILLASLRHAVWSIDIMSRILMC